MSELAGLFQQPVLTDPSECLSYGYDNSCRQGMPDAVVFPTTHEEVKALVQYCLKHKIPLTARGGGTGTPGGAVPVAGGIVASFERMNRILNLDAANRTMTVEPGVTNAAVQTAAREAGFFWAPDPSSSVACTVGGNLAFNAAGPRAVKYGTTRENTLALTAVLGNGDTIRTGTQTTKGVVGYDLTRLLIGSEGTLGIITEATLKLLPLPETITTLQAQFASIHGAAEAVSAIMGQSVTPCALEFIDGAGLNLIREECGDLLHPHAKALLLIEVDGPAVAATQNAEAIQNACARGSLLTFHRATTEAEKHTLWQARKAFSPKLRDIAPKKINEDVVVPVSKMPDFIDSLEALSAQYQIPIVNFGHAGNGNIHVNLLIDESNPVQKEGAEACLCAVFDLVLSFGGTLSGEHGVGMDKRDFIAREVDPTTLAQMQRVKALFDPSGILNPQKMFPLP